jgi:hypothetical protein
MSSQGFRLIADFSDHMAGASDALEQLRQQKLLPKISFDSLDVYTDLVREIRGEVLDMLLDHQRSAEGEVHEKFFRRRQKREKAVSEEDNRKQMAFEKNTASKKRATYPLGVNAKLAKAKKPA